MMNQSAQGLASLGRGNDSMLVHMTPREVQGLQGLAMAHGGSLSINPQTGLPEAGFLDFVLPIAGSFLGMPPWLTASLMAGKTLIEGGDIGDAALSAFSSYGGAKLGEGLKTFVDPIKQSTTAALNTANTAGSFVGPTGEMGSKLLSQSGGASQIGSNLGSVTNEFGVNRPVEDVFKESFKPDFAKSNFVPGFADNNLQGSFMGKDFSQAGMNQAGGTTTGYAFDTAAKAAPEPNMFSDITDQASKFPDQFSAAVKNPVDFARHIGEGDALYGGAKIGMYGASPFLKDALTPPEYAGYQDPEKGKYTGPQGQLNLSNKYSSGLKLLPNLNAKEGGYINGYAMGGTVQSGGIRDLYGTPDNPPTMSTGLGGFGLGRLNDLANEQARTQAQTYGYAEGGDVGADAVDESAPNPEGVVSKYTTVVDDKGVASRARVPYQYERIITPGALDFSTISPIEYAANAYPGSILPRFKKEGMAKGGYLNGAGDGMSDSIPATIEGKQPARLADGEFVIPADVVSHLGNGSSKAGSKRLYAMLDKIRHARTGTKKQGKEINPAKYMPA